MASDRYWRSPPEALLSAASMVEFVVLDCEPAEAAAPGGRRGKGGRSQAAVQLWEVVVSPSNPSIDCLSLIGLWHSVLYGPGRGEGWGGRAGQGKGYPYISSWLVLACHVEAFCLPLCSPGVGMWMFFFGWLFSRV